MVTGAVIRNFIAWLCAAALLAAAPAAAPQTYKWVDDNGITQYSQARPRDRKAEKLWLRTPPRPAATDCASLTCRAARLESERAEKARLEQHKRDAAARAVAAYPVFPTPVKETDDEKIARLVAECKKSRGSKCDSDEEKRRMLLQNVELTQAERRALRGLSPARQRRALNQRIPKQYRDIE